MFSSFESNIGNLKLTSLATCAAVRSRGAAVTKRRAARSLGIVAPVREESLMKTREHDELGDGRAPDRAAVEQRTQTYFQLNLCSGFQFEGTPWVRANAT